MYWQLALLCCLPGEMIEIRLAASGDGTSVLKFVGASFLVATLQGLQGQTGTGYPRHTSPRPQTPQISASRPGK